MKVSKEAREMQVETQMDNLKDQLSELEKGVQSLRDRLNSVLRNDPFDSSENKEDDDLVPLAKDIRVSADRVNNVTIEIANLLRQLEL